MKNFEMPVVAVNEMLMSESIASMCCFAESSTKIGGSIITTKTVLNGGSIESVVTKTLPKWITNYFGSIENVPDVQWEADICWISGGVQILQDTVKVLYYNKYADGTIGLIYKDQTELTEKKYDGGLVNIRRTSAISPLSDDYPYLETSTASNQHVGSLVAHYPGFLPGYDRNWQLPHKAEQFNS